MSVVSLLELSSQVSVNIRKSILCSVIISLIKNDLLDRDLALRRAILVVGEGLLGGEREFCINTGSRLAGLECEMGCVSSTLGLIITGMKRGRGGGLECRSARPSCIVERVLRG